MKKFKEEKGITLVALIITIVVLLILAVVAIGSLQESKIIGHAQNAAGGYNQAKANEIGYLIGYEETINKYVPTKDNKGENEPKIEYYKHIGDGETVIVVDYDKNELKYYYTGEVNDALSLLGAFTFTKTQESSNLMLNNDREVRIEEKLMYFDGITLTLESDFNITRLNG